MELWYQWEENTEERLSFDDSDRFEEDSLCSWASEPESLCNNWRGWKRNSQTAVEMNSELGESKFDSLMEICARTVAKHLPFEAVERAYPQIPEQLQLRIAFWSFPPFEEDVRLYSCLANGSPDKFNEGEKLLNVQAVKDALQIGFHLSATVHQPYGLNCQSKGTFNVAVTFDRGRITSCYCTCQKSASWCAHVIALCLFRIHFPDNVCLRAPVSEYLSRLKRDQLQKFAQYLISELPQQLLPTAQRLLDELLSSQESVINLVQGAPDPTAGPSEADYSKWCLDEASLHENIKRMLIRFCGPSPLVFSDVNALYLANTAPPTAAEWSNLLRPLRGREPEGMWNLLSIVRELFHRGDLNAVNLLVILTEECLANDQVMVWWFDSRSQASGNSLSHSVGNRGNTNAASNEATKHACAGFCDELVSLWRLAVLNPKLTDAEREEMKLQLQEWHDKALARGGQAGRGGGHVVSQTAVSCFPGFLAAIEACDLDWRNVELGLESEDNVLQVTQARRHPCAGVCYPEAGKHTDTVHVGAIHDSIAPTDKKDLEQKTEPYKQEENAANSPVSDVSFAGQDMNEDLEVLCARTEALHVHGYREMAGKLAVKLAENILNNGNNLVPFSHSGGTRNKRRGPGKGSFARSIFVKAAFLCSVLEDDLHLHHLAFRVGMMGLEMPRQPARSKALEVKLCYQESELATLLKRLPLGPAELAVIREKAELLFHGKLKRGEAVLPIMLATFIFDVLCPCSSGSSKRQVTGKLCETNKEDEALGFKAALYALGMKGNALETQYPMLCEGTRRQRGDLAQALLFHNKDDNGRIREIMDVLLDKDRYDLPNATRERQNKKKEEKNDCQDNKSQSSETSNDDTVSNRSNIGLPTRQGNNGQSSSSTSDSGTDKSKDRSKPRVLVSRIQAPKSFITVQSASLDDESGTSSGVDTDPLPTSRDQERLITVEVVEVAPTKTGETGKGDISNSDEAKSVFLSSPQGAASFAADNLQPNVPGTEIRNRSSSFLVSLGTAYDKEVVCSSHYKQEDSFHPNFLTNPNDVNPGLSLYNGNERCDDKESLDFDRPAGDLSCNAGAVPCANLSGEGVSDLADNDPRINEMPVSGLPLLYSNEIYPRDDLSREEVSAAMSSGASLDGSSLVNKPPPSSISSGNNSFSCKRAEIERGNPAFSQYHSSEGDVSDIEADIEESHLKLSKLQVFESPAAAGTSSDSSPTSYPSGPTAFFESEPSASGESSYSGANLGHEYDGADAACVIVPALEEVSEEQSSGSGARGSSNSVESCRGRRRSRIRRRRRRGKLALYQATEAEAHFMFELAKTVLTKAGGNSSTSVFTQTTNTDTQTGPHRGLQLCAFEIGLFALGLHNGTSRNWLSRTYSSHVSWISGQAMEIGHQAIAILLDHWEGNLTPSEVASIADRASRSNDRTMVNAAAKLGLSCLHMATTLNPVEIQRALSQCREEDSQLLDQACQAVESAALGGGVYPEVLFNVAKHWFYLHEKDQLSNSTSRPSKNEARNRGSLSRPAQSTTSSSHSPPLSPFAAQISQFTIPPSYSSIPPPLYTTPAQYVHQKMHHQVHQMMGHYSAYLPPNCTGYRAGSQPYYSYPFSRTLPDSQFSLSGAYTGLTPPPYQVSNVTANPSQHMNRLLTTQQGTQISYYLNSAYRAGMLALEVLSRRASDDRPVVKFSRNPSYSEDIRWLCTLSAKLGTSHLQGFCVATLNAVVSPFVLHELALEAARHMARSNPSQLAANLRSPTISPLVQKSLTMYAQCIHYNLISISQNEYDEFVELLRHARGAFCMAPGGMTQFNELLQSIRRGHSKKKDLWQMIIAGLAKA
ncbi:PREDICTED: zinc finger SWIM domain-containing protein 8-like isoform X2 [Acropora digitifera]|uniref:zinc finger SWIM domain-containing protein 8-like isoform X2 n=1 Tax=Acropora digitifera TaxID=70779 RepID=UPI000779FFB3|nr:PREDICTED: zinc finger SWIM domain-containing protein 8-like isoform X2 [Acropora digitifera]